jgi:glycosyltransferase involved in cell wall biosynthesis
MARNDKRDSRDDYADEDRLPTLLMAGKYHWPLHFLDNQLDSQLILSLKPHFRSIYCIVQAQGPRFGKWQDGRISVYYVPTYHRWLDSLVFVLCCCALSVWIHARDRIDIFNSSDFFGGLAGLGMKHLLGVRLVHQVQLDYHDLPPEVFPTWLCKLMWWVTLLLSKNADRVRCCYAGLADALAAAGAPYEKMVVLGARSDVSIFDSDRLLPYRNDLRRSLGLRDEYTILYVGSLGRRKGVHYLLEALPGIAGRVPQVKLLLIGDGRLRGELEAMVRGSKMADRVKFLGEVPHHQIAECLALSDVFVFPSLSEAMPRAVFEAMSMAVPVVATRVGGIPEVVEDGVTGILVDPGDSEQIVASVTRLFENPDLAHALGQRARALILQEYTNEIWLEKFVRLHFDALEN